MNTDTTISDKAALVTDVIRSRRTIFADSFTNELVSPELLEELLTNATWAPTHKRTEPWRFVLLEGTHPQALGEYMAEFYKKVVPQKRYEAIKQYCQNATLVAIMMKRSNKASIPEWEELAAVSCAVQNLWLSCAAYGLGGYWDTCEAMMQYSERFAKEGERSLGIFLLGHYNKDNVKAVSRRKSLAEKLSRDNGHEQVRHT